MISFDEAFEKVAAAVSPLGSESVPLADAFRRVLAEPVVAMVNAPPADVSAMDGYAVRESDLGAPLTVIGASFPGAPFLSEVGPGQCVRIFTGAAIPVGADRVIVQEIARRDGESVTLTGSFSASRHVRSRGADFRAGSQLLNVGRLLDARALVVAAGADCGSLAVWRRPRVAILGTGDELVAPGEARNSPDRIPESVSIGVAAMAAQWGGEVVSSERLPDQPEVIAAGAARALEAADLVVVSGGASVGDKDFAKPVFAGLGLELLFSKVSVKPGKPVWLGRARGRLVLGLPGNPSSAMVTARLLMAPLLAGLSGRQPAAALRWRGARLAQPIEACGDRETFMRGRWAGDTVEPLSNQDSGAQLTLADADLLIRRRPGAVEAAAGDVVEVIDF